MIGHNTILLISLLSFGLLIIHGCNSEESTPLKIMSYNIRHGEGMDSILDLSRSLNIIKSAAPDLICLQEVDDFCLRSDSVGQTQYIARHTSMKGTFGKFMDFQGGAYGMATLSSKPLVSSKILNIPDAKYEPRISIVHEVQIAKSCTISFANVHLDWISDQEGGRNRLAQAKALVIYLDSLNRTTIITGDFNCTPDSPTMQYFADHGYIFVDKGDDSLSFQGEKKGEIDHLIYRCIDGQQIILKNVKLLDATVVSDHRPLVVELEVTF